MLSKDPQRQAARKLRRQSDLADVAERAAGKTLASALSLYWKANGIDPDTVSDSKGTRERDRYWREWLEHLEGDYVLSKRDASAIDAIQQAFDNWQDEMLGRGCSHETVARARSAVIAVIRWLSQEYRLGWHIELKRLPAKKRTAKQTLSVEEQRRLLSLIADQPSETTAMIAVMLAGGVMASEIKRMDPDAVTASLASVYPYVAVGAGDVEVKTEARRRFVPIVWDTQVLEVVREYLPQAIQSLANTADPTARVNKWLRTRGFTGITCHRLRDTMASVATAAVANPLVLARVGGWSGSGLNPTMLGYGAGDESNELLRTLTEEVARWWAPALTPDSPDGGSNVVQMRRTKGGK
jgi:integrase